MSDAEFVELADELATYAGDPLQFVLRLLIGTLSSSSANIRSHGKK